MSEPAWKLAGEHVDHGPYQPVHRLIEAQVDRTPDRVAVIHRRAGDATDPMRMVAEQETTLSYAEFDALANGLAHQLADDGIRAGDLVPVLVGNSVELPLVMVALLKTGAAFALCDPAWPQERLSTVFQDLDPPLVITSGPLTCTVRPTRVVSLTGIIPSTDRPDTPTGPQHPAYGVFTSGTTGTPKCAVNVHGGLANRFRFMSRYFGATGTEVVLQNSRHTFDSAIWQLLWPLTTGGSSVIPEQGEFLDLERTIEVIQRYEVTVTDFVPAILGSLVALLESDLPLVGRIRSLRQVVVGGEEIIPHAVHRLRELLPELELTNGYGPSETAIGMIFHRITGEEGDRIPLGRPIDNCYAFVADTDLTPLPAGRVGELVIGGACVGAGYHADPTRTAECFPHNPYPGIPGTRLYRTGDLASFDEDGQLRFIGRRDRQTKVDGVRIELGEIEAAAEACAGVIQAKALTLPEAERRRNRLVLAAAVEEGTSPGAVRAHLASVLPRVQVPRHCFVLQALPLSDNGKVDHRALRAVVEDKLASESPVVATAEEAGGTPAERIARIMGGVLGLPDFSVHDDFLQCGGDSLTALSATLRLRESLGAQLGLADLYTQRSPAALASTLYERSAAPRGPEQHTPGNEASGPPPERKAGNSRPQDQRTLQLMERDSVLPPEVAKLAQAAGSRLTPEHADKPRGLGTVLVTGATGFVGARTVRQLLTDTDAQVVCLTRGTDDVQAHERVVRALRTQQLWDGTGAERLRVWHGDLDRPRFGWTSGEWHSLAAQVDVVLHIGAMVNFLLDYGAHRAPNVAGSTEVLRFALTARPKPMHHVSTLGVLDQHAERVTGPLHESFDPSTAIAPMSGYSRSKWVAERRMLAARGLGAPVTVYRLGEVMPATDNGLPNPRALTHLLLSAVHRLGLRPDVPMASDYTPVDEVAGSLVTGLSQVTSGGVYHVFRDGSIDFGTLKLSGEQGGQPARVVSGAEFMTALRRMVTTETESAEAVLYALLTTDQAGRTQAAPDFRRLLTDNPRLFRRAGSTSLHPPRRASQESLETALAAYRSTLVG